MLGLLSNLKGGSMRYLLGALVAVSLFSTGCASYSKRGGDCGHNKTKKECCGHKKGEKKECCKNKECKDGCEVKEKSEEAAAETEVKTEKKSN